MNPKTGKNRIITALLDSGGKKTYLTEQVAELIQVERGPTKVTKLNTFSTTTTSSLVTSESIQHQAKSRFAKSNYGECMQKYNRKTVKTES